jgi:hypothetical protein
MKSEVFRREEKQPPQRLLSAASDMRGGGGALRRKAFFSGSAGRAERTGDSCNSHKNGKAIFVKAQAL